MSEIRIENPQIEKDEQGNIKRVTLVFGPHYFIDILPDENGDLTLYMGATHHGFKAAAGEVNGELEKIINEIRQQHLDLAFD